MMAILRRCLPGISFVFGSPTFVYVPRPISSFYLMTLAANRRIDTTAIMPNRTRVRPEHG
jgi:hypothetical protein